MADKDIRLTEFRSRVSDTAGAFIIQLPTGSISISYEQTEVRRGILNQLDRDQAKALAIRIARFLRDHS